MTPITKPFSSRHPHRRRPHGGGGGPGGKADQRGFTLVELMVTVAIAAILAAIAYPAYTGYVQRARRADAQAALMELAGWMERRYSTSFRYDETNGGDPTLPTPSSQSVSTYYTFTVTLTPSSGRSATVPATAFTLNAARAGVQASDPCGTLTLNSQGVRGVTGAASGWSATNCWQR